MKASLAVRLAVALDGGTEGQPLALPARWRAWWGLRKVTLPTGPLTPAVCEQAFVDGFQQGMIAGQVEMARIWDKHKSATVD